MAYSRRSNLRTDRDALIAALQPVFAPIAALEARLEAVEQAAIAHAEHADDARLAAEAAQRARATPRHRRGAAGRGGARQLRDEALAARDVALQGEEDARERARRDIDAANLRPNATGAPPPRTSVTTCAQLTAMQRDLTGATSNDAGVPDRPGAAIVVVSPSSDSVQRSPDTSQSFG